MHWRCMSEGSGDLRFEGPSNLEIWGSGMWALGLRVWVQGLRLLWAPPHKTFQI